MAHKMVTIHVLGTDGLSPDFDLALKPDEAYDADVLKKKIADRTGRTVHFFKFIVPLDQVRYSVANASRPVKPPWSTVKPREATELFPYVAAFFALSSGAIFPFALLFCLRSLYLT